MRKPAAPTANLFAKRVQLTERFLERPQLASGKQIGWNFIIGVGVSPRWKQARNADAKALRPEQFDEGPCALPINCPCLRFNELNYSYTALSDVHGNAAHDDFQTVWPIMLITPTALDPKTRKLSALLGPAEVDAATCTGVTVGAPFADPLFQGSYGMCEAASSTTATHPATMHCVHSTTPGGGVCF